MGAPFFMFQTVRWHLVRKADDIFTRSSLLFAFRLQEVQSGSDTLPTMYPDLFDQLLTFTEYAVKAPKFGRMDAKSVTAKGIQVTHQLPIFIQQ